MGETLAERRKCAVLGLAISVSLACEAVRTLGVKTKDAAIAVKRLKETVMGLDKSLHCQRRAGGDIALRHDRRLYVRWHARNT